MNTEELQLVLREGEDHFTEFKAGLTNIDCEIVAFANANGGCLYIGVDDAGDPVGLNITNRLKSQVQDIARNCDPSIHIKLEVFEELSVLRVLVDEGEDKPYQCKDGFFLRNGPSSQKLRRNEIMKLISQHPRQRYDELLNLECKYPEDFSQEALEVYLKKCSISVNAQSDNLLVSLNTAKHKDHFLTFNNAGVLFFAKEPQKFLPEAYITCVKYKSNDRFSILDKKDFKGGLIQQIDDALSFIERHMSTEYVITNKGQREELSDYPMIACREALINAVTHRDYRYDASHIYVHFYSDRLEIESPGELYHGVDLTNIQQRGVRRNLLIADLLHRAGYIERVGSGFDRMKRSLEENHNPPFEISATNFFDIRFYPRVAGKGNLSLSIRQSKILSLIDLKCEVTKSEVATSLGVSEDTALRELKSLISLGLVEKIGQGKSTRYGVSAA